MIGTCDGRPDHRDQGEAVDVGQAQVEQHHVGWSAQHLLQPGQPGAGGRHGVPRSVSPRRTALRIASSSSTTRMLAMPARYLPRGHIARATVRLGCAVMSPRLTIAIGVAAWLFVVTAGAGLVWAVISRAGEGVSSSTSRPSRPRRPPRRSPGSAVRHAGRGEREPAYLAGGGRVRHRRVHRAPPSRSWAPSPPRLQGRAGRPRPGPAPGRVRSEGGPVTVEARCRDGRPDFERLRHCLAGRPRPDVDRLRWRRDERV